MILKFMIALFVYTLLCVFLFFKEDARQERDSRLRDKDNGD